MALKYPDILRSNNPAAYGIVPATEVSGHKQVANLTALYALADPILSLSGNNTDNDAIGQIWYVVDQAKHYQLVSWANRDKETGWVVYGGFKDGDTDFFANGIVTEITNSQDEDSFSLHVISSTRNADGTWVEGDDQTIEIPTATDEKAGVMSAQDKDKLDGIAEGATKVVETTVSDWGFTKNTGTVTKVTAGDGLNGGDITTTGTVSLKKATATTLGGVKIGSNLAVDNNGVLSGNYPNASESAGGLMSKDDKAKLNNIAAGAEVNQNAFANVKVGGTTIAADAKQDTIELVAGDNITITPDATNDKITIEATDTTYTAATTEVDGLMPKEVVANMGTTALIGVEDATGTVTQATDKVSVSIETTIQDKNYITGATDEDTFTTTFAIPQASTDKAGVMSSADKAKLDNLKPATLGQGYGTCTTGATTAAKVVTLSSYELVTGGIVSVKFDNAVGASATMNINGKGAKPIYYRGSAIVTGVIGAGDVTTFIYDGSKYIYLGTDNALSRVGGTITGEVMFDAPNDENTQYNDPIVRIKHDGITVEHGMNDPSKTTITTKKVESPMIVKSGGTEKQILMADGSVAGTITTAWLEANLT